MDRNLHRFLWPILFAILYVSFAPALSYAKTIPSILLFAILVWVCISDSNTFRVPNLAVIWLIVTGMIYLAIVSPDLFFVRMLESLATFFVVYAFVKILVLFLPKAKFGGGDIKLVAASTIWIGLSGIYIAALAACFAGLLSALLLSATGRLKLGQAFPFAPFVATAVWSVWLNSLQ